MTSKTKEIVVGGIRIGGGNPISVQTMTNTDTCDVEKTLEQIERAREAGCDLIRVSVPTKDAALAFGEITQRSKLPIIADIHFNYRRAIESIERGAACVRINPGNIAKEHIAEIVRCSKDNGTAIRIGINSGSLERDILDEFKEPSAKAIVKSALRHVHNLEDLDFFNFKISVKSSDVMSSIDAARALSKACDYPQHLGITESGTLFSGTIKSAIGIGALLADGIGDTIRVSLSADIVDEIKVGRQVLRSLGLLKNGVNIISCPTCARANIDVIALANSIETLTQNVKRAMSISILGCVVNGPGEAAHSDIGIFGFEKGIAKIYVAGKEFKTVPQDEILGIVEDIIIEK